MKPGKVLLVMCCCAVMTSSAGCRPAGTASPSGNTETTSPSGNTGTTSSPGNTETTSPSGNTGTALPSGNTENTSPSENTGATASPGNARLAEISADAAGNWAIEIPETQFVPYATAKYGASSSSVIPMVTIMAPAKGYRMTTAETAGEATFEIAFTFAQPLVTCGLHFGTLINSTGGNDGYVQVDVTTDEGTTMVYYHQSVDENSAQPRSDNYKGDVPAPDVERLYAHSQIDALVAGKTEFTLSFSLRRCNEPVVYHGAAIMMNREESGLWPESDFRMSGTMIPPPVAIVESDGNTQVAEQGATSDSYVIALSREPSQPVTVTATPKTSDIDLGAGPGVAVDRTFAPGDWAARTVTVTAVDDTEPGGDGAIAVVHAVTSDDPYFRNAEASGVGVLVLDNDFDPGTLRQTVVFRAGQEGYNNMRIPGIVLSKQGTLLAFCEGRVGADRSRTNVVLKRSQDGGRTWGPMQLVLEAEQETDAYANVCPVADTITGDIFFFVTLFPDGPVEIRKWEALRRYGVIRTIVTKSTDDGLTWSAPIDITEQITDVKTDIGKKTGPGAGIQTSDGRLVIPYGIGPELESRAMIVYSDDHGETWHAGGRVDSKSTETQVVELSDGSLRLDTRNQRPQEEPHCRYYSISRDRGKTWTEPVRDEALLDTACQASILRHPFRQPGHDKDPILFANAAATFQNRVNMTVRLSYDDGKTWPVAKSVHPGPSAYCCLVALPDGSIGLLYEGGDWVYERINFARFDLAWLTQDQTGGD